jgi:hypothetical protein
VAGEQHQPAPLFSGLIAAKPQTAQWAIIRASDAVDSSK